MTPLPSERLSEVISWYLGPPPGRHGEHSGRPWWLCCFHDDRNPSLTLTPSGEHYHCFGCGAHGDVIDFVRKGAPSLTFLEAKAIVWGEAPPHRAPVPARQVSSREPVQRPEGWQDFAHRVIERAEAALWSDRGESARAYLQGRGLSNATIRAARLGVLQEDMYVDGVFPDKPIWVPAGITIPWLEESDVAMVNIRRPAGIVPKYWAVRGSRRGIYPSKFIIATGRPLLLAEGEFEAMLLNQELNGLVPAITLGSAGDRPKPQTLAPMLGASPWFVAGDSDAAGESSAEAWLALSGRCRRVRPPAPWKDWTEVKAGGVDLRRWWSDRLGGVEAPLLFTWDELSAQRWGPAAGDPAPGIIVVDRPDRVRMRAALERADADRDPDARAERQAIQAESDETRAC